MVGKPSICEEQPSPTYLNFPLLTCDGALSHKVNLASCCLVKWYSLLTWRERIGLLNVNKQSICNILTKINSWNMKYIWCNNAHHPLWLPLPCPVLLVLLQLILRILRYESSTLILYKELSSTIFQSLSVSQSVRHPWHLSRSPLCAIYKGINAFYCPHIN